MHHIRLFGVVLLVIGILLGGWGLYQDYTAPPCPDPIQPSGQNVVGGACEEPGLMELFGGVALTITGVAVFGVSHIILRRRDARTE